MRECVCVFMYICTYIHTHIYMYTCTHAHTQKIQTYTYCRYLCNKQYYRVHGPKKIGYALQYCSVLLCVQYIAVCYSVLQCVAMWCSVLQCVAVCCRILPRTKARRNSR